MPDNSPHPAHPAHQNPRPSKKSAAKLEKRLNRDAGKINHLAEKVANLDTRTDQKSKKKAAVNRTQMQVLQRGVKRGLQEYIRCLINPCLKNEIRLPDTFNFPTALVHSRHVIEISGNFVVGTAPSDLGRFVAIVSPTMAAQPFMQNVTDYYALTSGAPSVVFSDYDIAQGAHVAQLSNDWIWSPDNSFVAVVPGPKSYGSTPLPPPPVSTPASRIGGPKAFSPPPINSANYWNFTADPNSDKIIGITGHPASAFPNGFEGGMAESIRPVGMSVWFQCTLPDLVNGGDVSACLLPPGSLGGNLVPYNWTSATPGTGIYTGQGSVCNWENLATFPGAYCGKLREGTFSYWVPSNYIDISMLDIQEHVAADYPSICISGQVMTGTGTTTSPGIIGKLEIETIWEYTTNSQIPEVRKGLCIPNVLEETKCVLYDQPTSMANGEHVAWWKRVLASGAAGVGGFLVGGPAGAAAAAGTVFSAL